MTRTLVLTLAAALAASATPALSKMQEIVVSADSAMVAVSKDLDRQIEAAARFGRRSHGDGYAIVRFRRGEDGRPAEVALYRRSGVLSVDRLARNAVRRLGGRDGLPDTGMANQAYQANIVLATSEQSYHKLAADLTRAEQRRLASAPAERAVVAVLAGSHKAS